MRRPPSYSDSFLVVNPHSPHTSRRGDPLLTPIVVPGENDEILTPMPSLSLPPPAPQPRPGRSRRVLCFLLTFKGSFHLLLISAFETLFYFLYVNKAEDAGILTTELNVNSIDTAGRVAAGARTATNDNLLMWAVMYSVFCATICGLATFYVIWQGWKVPWRRMIGENILFVMILGLYEYFFFRTIIYRYTTISTPELNQYIVDGLASCSGYS